MEQINLSLIKKLDKVYSNLVKEVKWKKETMHSDKNLEKKEYLSYWLGQFIYNEIEGDWSLLYYFDCLTFFFSFQKLSYYLKNLQKMEGDN